MISMLRYLRRGLFFTRNHGKTLLSEHLSTPSPLPIPVATQERTSTSRSTFYLYTVILNFIEGCFRVIHHTVHIAVTSAVNLWQWILILFLSILLLVGSSAIFLAVGHIILQSARHPKYSGPVWPSTFQVGAVGGAVIWVPLLGIAFWLRALHFLSGPFFAGLAGMIGVSILQHSVETSLKPVPALGAGALGGVVVGGGLIMLYSLLFRHRVKGIEVHAETFRTVALR